MPIQPLTVGDVPQVLEVQKDAYLPQLIESAETFVKKMQLFPRGCLGFFDEGKLLAYVFSHPWSGDQVVPLDCGLADLPEAPDCLYIHDLAVRRDSRSRRIGGQLVEALFSLAQTLRIRRFMLVAVQGSEGFWTRWGFIPQGSLDYAAGVKGTRMEAVRDAGLSVARATVGDIDAIMALGLSDPAFEVNAEIRFYERTELVEWVNDPQQNILLVARTCAAGSAELGGFLFCKQMSHHWAVLENAYVRPGFRNGACRRALLRALWSELRARGIEYVSTLAEADQPRLITFLQHAVGFERRKQYVWLDKFLDRDERE